MIEKAIVARADPQRGRFRSFLLTSLKNHHGQERLRANAQKRGGGAPVISLDETVAEDRYAREPADPHGPDELFERRWAVTLVETVLQKLEAVGHVTNPAGFDRTLVKAGKGPVLWLKAQNGQTHHTNSQ